jgi:hypothetical protein
MTSEMRRPRHVATVERPETETTKEQDSNTAVSRTRGALRLLRNLRGPAEHRSAILSSVLRRLLEAAAAVERELRELAA